MTLVFSLTIGFLTYAMHYHREIIYFDEAKKMTHNSQIVRAKEKFKLSNAGPSEIYPPLTGYPPMKVLGHCLRSDSPSHS